MDCSDFRLAQPSVGQGSVLPGSTPRSRAKAVLPFSACVCWNHVPGTVPSLTLLGSVYRQEILLDLEVGFWTFSREDGQV